MFLRAEGRAALTFFIKYLLESTVIGVVSLGGLSTSITFFKEDVEKFLGLPLAKLYPKTPRMQAQRAVYSLEPKVP